LISVAPLMKSIAILLLSAGFPSHIQTSEASYALAENSRV
jgi:hypothetical protein